MSLATVTKFLNNGSDKFLGLGIITALGAKESAVVAGAALGHLATRVVAGALEKGAELPHYLGAGYRLGMSYVSSQTVQHPHNTRHIAASIALNMGDAAFAVGGVVAATVALLALNNKIQSMWTEQVGKKLLENVKHKVISIQQLAINHATIVGAVAVGALSSMVAKAPTVDLIVTAGLNLLKGRLAFGLASEATKNLGASNHAYQAIAGGLAAASFAAQPLVNFNIDYYTVGAVLTLALYKLGYLNKVIDTVRGVRPV